MLAKVVGIILLYLAFNYGQDVLEIKRVGANDVFMISGLARFVEQTEKGKWRAKKKIYAQVRNYPASFFIDNKNNALSANHFNSLVKATDTVQIAIPKEELALLYTKSTVRLYGISLTSGKVLYSYNDAASRDKDNRLWLYVQIGICLVGGLILLVLPKRYLIKE
jgi:hypothetical protein